MSAAEALKAARAAGINLCAEGGDLLLEASTPPPAAILDRLARHKAEVVSLLQAADEVAFSERAAALEHDAGLQRAEAERQAAAEQGFASAEALLAAVVAGWVERLHGLKALERSFRGQQCVASALAFIRDGWALAALRCGWSALELVGACPVAPWERLDRLGSAYSGGTVVAVTAEAIFYHSSGKAPLRLLRGSQADGAVLPWERA